MLVPIAEDWIVWTLLSRPKAKLYALLIVFPNPAEKEYAPVTEFPFPKLAASCPVTFKALLVAAVFRNPTTKLELPEATDSPPNAADFWPLAIVSKLKLAAWRPLAVVPNPVAIVDLLDDKFPYPSATELKSPEATEFVPNCKL